jgi:acyl carrier protein
MDQSIFDRVRDMAADVLQADSTSITADSSPETIETWDSLQNPNRVLALEAAFGFEFAPEEMDQMKTVGKIAEVVVGKQPA